MISSVRCRYAIAQCRVAALASLPHKTPRVAGRLRYARWLLRASPGWMNQERIEFHLRVADAPWTASVATGFPLKNCQVTRCLGPSVCCRCVGSSWRERTRRRWMSQIRNRKPHRQNSDKKSRFESGRYLSRYLIYLKNLVEAAEITPPYKSIAYVAKRQKCPPGYPRINPAE
jgi:hypothetical protein